MVHASAVACRVLENGRQRHAACDARHKSKRYSDGGSLAVAFIDNAFGWVRRGRPWPSVGDRFVELPYRARPWSPIAGEKMVSPSGCTCAMPAACLISGVMSSTLFLSVSLARWCHPRAATTSLGTLHSSRPRSLRTGH